MERKLISKILPTGIKAIDAVCTIGQGQRIGIFSGAGLGKSMLLGMIAKMSTADIKVIALIGERGKEVREFIDRDLGYAGLARSIVVVVTSEQAALLRQRGAHAAMAIAEYFRDLGKNVLFIMDSLSRYAMALREVGLATGEPPTTRGYTPSVFAMLPKLLERAGASDKGVITGFYSVFAEGDDLNDPVVDTMRALLDGHIVLSRQLAESSHYPAIDILSSLSRSMRSITSPEHDERASRLRSLLHVYKESEDLINIGAYVTGMNPQIDQAIASIDSIKNFLKQEATSAYPFEKTLKLLKEITSL
jgi:FliI/YscN family ATPase